MAMLRGAFEAGKERFGFRLVQFSVQADHLHLIAEADDSRALSRGMRALGIRIARRLNRVLRRTGRVFVGRFHARQLKTPTEVRNALRYVLNNAQHHGRRGALPDPCSSGPAFDGWRDRIVSKLPSAPVCAARSWLLRVGWRKRGRIGLRELPAGAG
jgi:putative transposase